MHAIIGSGRVAINHIYGFKEWGCEIKWCCDLSIDKAKAFAEKYNIPNYTDNYYDILNDPNVDTVSVCTDHGSHASITIDALNCEKNVIVEKPIALSLKDAKKMIDVAKQKKRVLAAVSQHRYDKMILAIKEFLNQNLFGKITMVSGFLQCSKDIPYYKCSGWRGTLEKEGGSTLINQAIHTLDLLILFLGEPTTVSSMMKNTKFKDDIETEDTLVAILEFSNGAIGTFATTNTSTVNWKSSIEIVGTKGSIGFTTGHPIKLTSFKLDNPNEAQIKSELEILEKDIEILPPSQSYYGVSHKFQIKDFLDAVFKKTHLIMNSEEAIKTLSTVLKIYKRRQK